MSPLYKIVKLPSKEPVQYVGVYVLHWGEHPDQPEVGFVEVEEPISSLIVDTEKIKKEE